MEEIAGRVIGSRAEGQQIVLFARSGTWWVQPFLNKPFTPIQRDSTWKSSTHMGTEYAALLVESGYTAPKTTDALPGEGGAVIAMKTVQGRTSRGERPGENVQGRTSRTSASPVAKTLHFSGYEWGVLQLPSDSAGVMHPNHASNVWTDGRGWLHLRIAKYGSEWAGAEISLSRSLGYGTYSLSCTTLPHWGRALFWECLHGTLLKPDRTTGRRTSNSANGGIRPARMHSSQSNHTTFRRTCIASFRPQSRSRTHFNGSLGVYHLKPLRRRLQKQRSSWPNTYLRQGYRLPVERVYT
jgi:hypothetical protein